jgi:MerR family transcriptional regulator, thiopeptide resistance regulator
VKEKKPSPKTGSSRALSSAECARRTGVTVRALRVYERARLLTPQRGANGWRIYGEREVQRLHDIITLKTLGLTLREIRDVLSAASPPSLSGVLQLQLQAWLARQAAAEQALKLVRAALARLAANHTLSIDELCELARSTETSYSVSTHRELINELIKPEEEREYVSWWSTRLDQANSMQAFNEAQRALFLTLERLRLKGADPTSAKVQAILDSHRELMLKHGVREQIVALMEWNPALTRKWMEVGERSRDQAFAGEPGAPGPFGPALYRFFIAGMRASRPGQAVRPLVDEAELLIKQKLAPTSKEGQSLAKRLTRVCRRFRLGDPTVWALSTAFIVKTERDGQWLDLDAVQQAPYRFLAEATRQVRVAIR